MRGRITFTPLDDPDTRATKTIKLRVTADQHADIQRRTREAGYTAVSKFMLATALADRPDGSDDLARRIGACGELLHDIRHLAETPRSGVTRSEVRRLIKSWEDLCRTSLAFRDLS